MKFKVKIKGILVKTLFIIIAVSFVMFGIVNFLTGVGRTNILKVGDEKVSVNRFAKFLNEKRNQYYNSEMSNVDLDFFNSKEFTNMALSEFLAEMLVPDGG